jgi:single-strand DNA-binding protein
MINSLVILKGNVGSVEFKYTPQGKLVGEVNLAVNIGYGENKLTNWYKCTVWEKTAEMMQKFVEKGTGLLIIGRQKISEWTDDNEVKHMKVEVTVQDFEVLARGKKREDAGEDEPEYMKD